MKKLLVGALALITLVAGCTGIARLKALRPAAVPQSPQLEIPEPVTVHRPAFQRGIQIDAYTYSGQDVLAAAVTDVSYIKSLHANAVMISFPYFVTGRQSTTAFATSQTPTPAELAIIIDRAEQAGLYVAIRPLLDETSLSESRVHWAPPDLAAWLASYRLFLKPYAQMAQRQRVGEFVVGAEFSKFQNSWRWNALDRSLRTWYHGTLAYANNARVNLTQASGGRVALKTVDIYPKLPPPFLASWIRYDRGLPRGTVASEVGIAAIAGAWHKPWVHDWPATQLDLQEQVHWFSAACHAAIATHLHGIYFWSLPLSTSLLGPSLTRQIDWAHSPGAAAISGCYAAQARASG
jgi:hypothetical protein